LTLIFAFKKATALCLVFISERSLPIEALSSDGRLCVVGLSQGRSEMQRPDDVNLSREEGEALIERLETQT
jgi:hypothetical protein